MSDHERKSRNSDMRGIHERLRDDRPEASDLELDRIKLRAMSHASRARRRPRRRLVLPQRLVGLAVGAALLCGGTGVFATTGVFAASGGFKGASSQGSASQSQYKPGKGCGDKNHVHEREDECDKPPK